MLLQQLSMQIFIILLMSILIINWLTDYLSAATDSDYIEQALMKALCLNMISWMSDLSDLWSTLGKYFYSAGSWGRYVQCCWRSGSHPPIVCQLVVWQRLFVCVFESAVRLFFSEQVCVNLALSLVLWWFAVVLAAFSHWLHLICR